MYINIEFALLESLRLETDINKQYKIVIFIA